jgi:hypothetical protein
MLQRARAARRRPRLRSVRGPISHGLPSHDRKAVEGSWHRAAARCSNSSSPGESIRVGPDCGAAWGLLLFPKLSALKKKELLPPRKADFQLDSRWTWYYRAESTICRRGGQYEHSWSFTFCPGNTFGDHRSLTPDKRNGCIRHTRSPCTRYLGRKYCSTRVGVD